MKRKLIAISGIAVLASCTTTTAPPIPTTTSRPMDTAGLERVIGQDAAGLSRLFGDPDQDFRESGARKLQFRGTSCVLDTYLYPPGSGREPVVTYVDARNASGEDVDRAACVEALARR